MHPCLPGISTRVRFWLGLSIGSVWVFHGLYSKILHGMPRHQLIVARVLGEQWAVPATFVIGVGEVLLGIWVFSGRARTVCAAVQTAILVTMNALEIALARDLLLSAPSMGVLNMMLLALGGGGLWRPQNLNAIRASPTEGARRK